MKGKIINCILGNPPPSLANSGLDVAGVHDALEDMLSDESDAGWAMMGKRDCVLMLVHLYNSLGTHKKEIQFDRYGNPLSLNPHYYL